MNEKQLEEISTKSHTSFTVFRTSLRDFPTKTDEKIRSESFSHLEEILSRGCGDENKKKPMHKPVISS